MVILFYLLAAWYVLIAGLLFRAWLRYIERDLYSLSPRERWLSGFMVFIATSLWPFTVPLAYMELLKKQSHSVRHMVEETVEELELAAKK